jgi:NAD(P)-dependent dehydrogenase (short-subunit alcohol dehydrogenase family)
MTRSIIITGGTGALGRGVVQRFVEAGDHVHILDQAPDGGEFVKQLPAEQVTYHALDVLNADAVKTWTETLNQVDVLVNIVGGFSMGAFAETPLKTLDHMLDLNLRSGFIMTQALLPLLKQSPQGRVVNIGARQALHGGADVSAYALSKAAVVNLTQSLAQELQSTPITVNAVVPSTINTPANRESMPDADAKQWVTPEDLAHSIFFLASAEARAISGAILPVYHRA